MSVLNFSTEAHLLLPPVFEVFLVRFAHAAHNYAHFNDSCRFDEELFANRMKVHLYNAKQIGTMNKARDASKPAAAEGKARDGAAEADGQGDKGHEMASADTGDPAATGPSGSNGVDLAMPAPPEIGNATHEGIAAEQVARCLEHATRGGRNFAANIRLIRSAVFRRDPQGKNKPLQNALRTLLNGARHGHVHEVQEALDVMKQDVDLGANM